MMIEKTILVIRLSWREFVIMYRNSYLGFLWAILYPLTNAFILWFVFTQAFKVQPNHGEIPFFVWLIVGMSAWNFFAEALVKITVSISSNAYLLKKQSFNLVLLPIINGVSAFFSHCLFLAIAIGCCIYYGVLPTFKWLYLLYYMSYIFILVLGIGYFTATLAVFVPDMLNGVNIFIQLFFWATPVFWSYSMLPEKYSFVAEINPLAYGVEGYRMALLGENLTSISPMHGIFFWCLSILLLMTCLKLFNKCKIHFADVL